MNSDDKCIATIVLAFMFMVIVLIWLGLHYDLAEKIAMACVKAGYSQQLDKFDRTVWVKP